MNEFLIPVICGAVPSLIILLYLDHKFTRAIRRVKFHIVSSEPSSSVSSKMTIKDHLENYRMLWKNDIYGIKAKEMFNPNNGSEIPEINVDSLVKHVNSIIEVLVIGERLNEDVLKNIDLLRQGFLEIAKEALGVKK